MKPDFDDCKWKVVTVPHAWAIFGPFDRNNDLQNVAVKGYNSFYCDVTPYINKEGKNILAVRLVTTELVCVPVWGTQITTPHVSDEYVSIRLWTEVANAGE